MGVFGFDGVSIAYEEAGRGDPVVFLHNLGADRSIWHAQVEALKETHHVYALDWMGFGDSDIPDEGYTIDAYLRLLTAFVESHGLQRTTLVGNCFGSALALLYARSNPGNVRALILVNPLTAATVRPTKTGRLAWAGRHLPARSLDALAAALKLPSPVAAYVLRDQLGQIGRARKNETLTKLRDRWKEPRRLVAVTALARELPRLAELDSFVPDADFPPVTTLWGAENRVLSPAAGARLNRTLKPQEAIVLPGCGHLAMTEEPDKVTQAIRSALDRSASVADPRR